MPTLRIDLNADLGEGAGQDAALLSLITSANIACGLHAGDPGMMVTALTAARDAGVAVGAHPGLMDREGFGRRELAVTPGEVFSLVTYQVGAFAALAKAVGVRPRHVKPHGALYNMAARDAGLAEAIVKAVIGVDRGLFLVAPPGSELARAGMSAGLRVVGEFFADRNYLPDGALVPRSRPDAVLHHPEVIAPRVLRMLRDGVVTAVSGEDISMRAETICLHGDNAEAVVFARALREALEKAGVVVSGISG